MSLAEQYKHTKRVKARVKSPFAFVFDRPDNSARPAPHTISAQILAGLRKLSERAAGPALLE